MSTFRPGDPTEIKSMAQLEAFFEPHARKRGRVGVELELLPLDARARIVPYSGPRGVEAALKAACDRCKPVLEGGHVIALLLAKGGMVSLEPGGQVEVDSPPVLKIADLSAFFESTLRHLSKTAKALDFGLFPWGIAPYGSPGDRPDVPKVRYRILKERLLRSGSMGRWMMKLTAASHYCLDYESEEDLKLKIAAALRLLPYVLAFTANAPIASGRRQRWRTKRPWIWRHTDPLRCGLPAFFFSERMGFAAYVRYALSRPLLFLVRDRRYVPGDGRNFGEWLERPNRLGPLTVGDWDLHLSTLFPDLRLRAGYLEIRTLDALPLPLFLAVAALFKGLLGEPNALQCVLEELPAPAQRLERQGLLDAARLGPAWVPDSAPSAMAMMPRVLALAARGLRVLGDEASWLSPLQALVDRGACPAHSWKKDGEGTWRGPGLFSEIG